MKSSVIVLIFAISIFGAGCQRIETGEIGLRVGFDKQVQKTELQPGSFNQTFVGNVLVFHVKQLTLDYKNLTPQTADHTNLKDMDVQLVYNVNPSAVYDIYTTKSQSMHDYENGDIFLMYNFMASIVNSSSQQAVSKYNALDVATHRSDIETDIRNIINQKLKEEKLDSSITIDLVQVRNAVPSDEVVQSATNVINAQNELRTKQVQLQTAKIEAERQEMLARPANIAYMKAQSELNISEGVKEGKVQTVLIPHGLTMFGGTGK